MLVRDIHIGNLIFYDYILSKRNPTFLSRNLTKALRIHLQEVEGSKLDPNPNRRLIVDTSHWSWSMSIPRSLDALFDRGKEEAFVLEIKGIQPLKLDKKSSFMQRPKKRGPLFIIQVDLYITIADPASGTLCQKIARKGVKMTAVHSEQGKEILLAMPTTIVPVEDLLSQEPREHRPDWRPTPQPWILAISMHFRDSKDKKEFHSHMPPSVFDGRDAPDRLVARHKNILQCTNTNESEHQVLPFAFTPDGNTLDYGLIANMYWTKKDVSILAAHNRQNSLIGRTTQYPTPPADISRLPPSDSSRLELIYVFEDHSLTRQDLSCPHPQCQRQLGTVDELRMHLDSWHDLFKYHYKNISNSDGIERWEFTCKIDSYRSDQQRASNAAPDPREIQVLAPRLPFDQKKYLNEGNDDFQRAARLTRTNSSKRSAAAAIASTVTARPKPKVPNEVRDRVQAERKTYRIPTAPCNVTFFRSITKRLLSEGEYISESDDDVEMDWVELKKHAHLDSTGDPTRKFLMAFDPYIKDERLQGDVHIGDAVIRFARAKVALLWQDNIADEFKTKLGQLLSDKTITQEIHDACLDIVAHNRPTSSTSAIKNFSRGLATLNVTQSSARGKQRNKRKGKAKISASGQLTPQTADSEGDVEMRDAVAQAGSEEVNNTPPYDQCLCGEDATCSSQLYIICEGLECVRHAYHLDCIRTLWYPEEPSPYLRRGNWKCKECENSPSEDTIMTKH